MARPAKLDDVIEIPAPTDEDKGRRVLRVRSEVIVERIRAGVPVETAVLSTGVSPSTYYRWRAFGEDRWDNGKLVRARPAYREFREATTRARAEAEAVHVGVIVKAATGGNWKASAWFLERSHPESWRRRETVFNAGPGDGDPAVPDQRIIHDVDLSAGTKLAELIDLVSDAVGRRPSASPPAEGRDGGAS